MSEARSLVGSTADPEQIKEAEAKVRIDRQQELEDMRAILALPGGRRILWRWIDGSHAMKPIWHSVSSLRDYQAGAQEVGLKIVEDIKAADFDQWLLMEKEAHIRELELGRKKKRQTKETREEESDE